MDRTPLISGNWKMNLNHFEAIQLVQKLSYELRNHDYDAVEVSLHPPYTDLRSVQTVIDADRMRFQLGAQNCHSEVSGAFTGEISPAMLAKLNVGYVIVGHSERRALFGESDEVVFRPLVPSHNEGLHEPSHAVLSVSPFSLLLLANEMIESSSPALLFQWIGMTAFVR